MIYKNRKYELVDASVTSIGHRCVDIYIVKNNDMQIKIGEVRRRNTCCGIRWDYNYCDSAVDMFDKKAHGPLSTRKDATIKKVIENYHHIMEYLASLVTEWHECELPRKRTVKTTDTRKLEME